MYTAKLKVVHETGTVTVTRSNVHQSRVKIFGRTVIHKPSVFLSNSGHRLVWDLTQYTPKKILAINMLFKVEFSGTPKEISVEFETEI